MVRGCQQQWEHCVAGLVVQMEAVAAVPKLVRYGQYVGEGRTLGKCYCPLQTEGTKDESGLGRLNTHKHTITRQFINLVMT